MVEFDFPSATKVCTGLGGLGDAVQGPIDPQTGQFGFVDDVLGGLIVTTVKGNFSQGNPGYAAAVDATVVISGTCNYTVSSGFAFCPPSWQTCAFPSARAQRST